jgi:hypothetical protein
VFRRAAAAAILVLCTLLGASASQAKNPSAGGQDLADVTPPSISGTAAVGATTTGDPGTWTGPGVKFSLQWARCDSSGGSCQPIPAATSSSYAVGSGDVGQTLRFQVVASNHSGSMSAVSNPTAAVTAPAPPPPAPTPTGDTQAPTAPASITVMSTAVDSVGISWPASTDNVAVKGYDVYKNGSAMSTPTLTSSTLSGLSCGTSYTVGVDAYDAAGNHSAKTSKTVSTSACPAPSSTQSSIYWGAYIEAVQTYNYLYGGTWSNAPWCDPGTQCALPRFNSNVGKASSIEHWGMCWTCTFDSGIANLVVGRGDIPAIDWANDSAHTDAAIASGQYDAWITTQAQAMKAFGHPLFLLFDEEMNGTWYPYSPGQNGNTVASFVAMWRHMHDIFTAVGATNVTWAWVPNVDPGGIYPSLGSLYPGDAYVDWTGMNGYNWGGNGWTSFASVFGSTYQTLLQVAPSKPIMLGEVASEENGGSKAAWITDAMTTQLPHNFPQIKAMLWFNWHIYEKSQYWNWEVESSSTSQQAFAQAVASPYYAAGGGFGNLPLLSKVQPLP